MTKQRLFIIIFFFTLILVPFAVDYMKQQQVKIYEQSIYENLVSKTEQTLKTLIREKQNTTTTIALGLANNESIKNYLKDKQNYFFDLKEYSLELRKTTTFKNVWFQLIDKNGYSLQRSWSDYSGDRIADARLDLQKALKNPQLTNSISVGKFDMTFKTMSPLYEGKEFLGFIEVITHFNSIDKKLAEKDISSVILADKSYTKQITKPFTKKFVDGYYIANLGAEPKYLSYLEKHGVENYINAIAQTDYKVDKELNHLISYYVLNNVNNKPMGHFLLFHSLEYTDMSKMKEIEYFYNILTILAIITLLALFYFSDILFPKNGVLHSATYKTFAFIIMVYIILASIIFFVIKEKYNADIYLYQQSVKNQTLLEFNSILQNKQDIAQLIFTNAIDNDTVKELIVTNQREKLYKLLQSKYKSFTKDYSIRQLHFHLPDATSFLRVHKPKKFGDNLSNIRESVVYVNNKKKFFSGFEEGRIYNGYRNVFPLNYNGKHIGSVEISFDIYSIINAYLETFNIKTVNFLVNKQIIDEKVFASEKHHYVDSTISGFAFDTLVLKKLEALDKSSLYYKKDKEILNGMSSKILQGNPFVEYFDNINELATVIPLNNTLSAKVMGSIHISKEAKYIQNRNVEFYQLIFTIMIVLGFIMIFIHREIISKYKLNEELNKSQIILDSQNTFIIITDGINLKTSNRSLLDFFNYSSLTEFKKNHKCICEFFIEEEGYITEQMDHLTWFEYLLQNPGNNHLVKILDTEKKEHIFYIEFNQSYKVGNDYVVSFIDITEIKQMEQQLFHNEKMASLGAMIGNIAHQWRQPLSVITTLASGIQMKRDFGKLNDKDLDESMENIITNSNYLSETIDTFRDFIKDDKIIKEHIIQDVIENTIKILQSSLNNNKINLIDKVKDSSPLKKDMPSGELSQVLTNIINNAQDVLLERNIQNPTITIECLQKEENIQILIEDNAGGIDETIIEKIFEPYFTTKHQSIGTGLGLYMSHKIVQETLNGQLSVENTDSGARFIIQFSL